ncbi:MAG: hypothetical protein J7M21_02845, partial [Planctomycetes bacterium]|nr:hypothetical protein [Planctomycetota bacterium]
MTDQTDKPTPLPAAVLAAAVAVALAGPPAAAAQPDPAAKTISAYDQLPKDRLIKQMSMLGMTELLEAMDSEISPADKSPEALATRGRVRVGIALALDDVHQRNKLLDEAIVPLRQAVKLAEKNLHPTPAETMEMYHYALDLAVALGRYRLENPHVLRLRCLQGSPDDRRIILKNTKEAVDLVDYLEEQVSDTLQDWRADMELLMIWVPRLEDLRDEVLYNAAWIRLNRCRALPPGGQRDQLCRDIIAEMKKFREDASLGVMYWAQYVTGVAYRIMGDHAKAEQFLAQAAGPRAGSTDLRLRAWFERARNRIEEGKPAAAEKAIDDFQRGAISAVGPSGQVMVDLRVVLLRNYYYQRLAAAEKDNAKAAELRGKAQDVLLGFVEKYADRPSIVRAFLGMVAAKFAGTKDVGKAGAVVMMARAYSKLDSQDPADQAEAEKLLRRLLVHPDMKSARVRRAILPGALWELAFLMNRNRNNIDAARLFVALAQRFPKHNLAFRSAENAVRSIYGVVKERLAKGKAIGSTLRLEYVRALRTLLAGWGDRPGVAKWYFDLGSQCMKLAESTNDRAGQFYWRTRAIAAFENVPPSLVEYMEAQHSALALRTQVVLGVGQLDAYLKPGNEKASADLRKLARLLIPYEKVDLATLAGPSAATRPAAATAGISAEELDRRADELRGLLTRNMKVYSDPAALVTKLQAYSRAAGAESAKVAAQAADAEGQEKKTLAETAEGLKEWAAAADYQAAVIKYEELTRGKKPQERQAIESQALAELRQLGTKWPGTSVLRQAFEFEIRKLVERGQTQDAIQKIKDFKAKYPEQSAQLIKLVVDQIQKQIKRLSRSLREAVTSSDYERCRDQMVSYQLAYAGFARDLYQPIKDLSMDLATLDQKVRDADAMEAAGDFDGLTAQADRFDGLCQHFGVEPAQVKSRQVLDEVLAAAKQATGAAERKRILPDLAAAFINVVADLRSAVQERYSLTQMYADALLNKAAAEKLQKNLAQARADYQAALDVYQKCRNVDDKRRKVLSDAIDAKYGPRIEAVKRQAG